MTKTLNCNRRNIIFFDALADIVVVSSQAAAGGWSADDDAS